MKGLKSTKTAKEILKNTAQSNTKWLEGKRKKRAKYKFGVRLVGKDPLIKTSPGGGR